MLQLLIDCPEEFLTTILFDSGKNLSLLQTNMVSEQFCKLSENCAIGLFFQSKYFPAEADMLLEHLVDLRDIALTFSGMKGKQYLLLFPEVRIDLAVPRFKKLTGESPEPVFRDLRIQLPEFSGPAQTMMMFMRECDKGRMSLHDTWTRRSN